MSVDHSPEWDELAALYALDALEGEELSAFRAHLRGCERCVSTVEQDRETLRNLSQAAPEVDASPGLKEKLLARARAELGEGEEISNVIELPTQAPTPIRRWRSAWYMPLAAVLVAALAVATMVGVIATQSYNQQIVASTALQGQVATGKASVLVRRSGSTELLVEGLSDPPAGQVYQAWIIAPNSAPQPAGTLAVGQGTLPLGQSVTGMTVAITVEPAPGRDAPSQAPFLVARAIS